GYRQERVNKSKTETIDIAKALTIGAGYQVSVGASKNESVGISSTEEVGLLKHTIVGEKYEVRVGDSHITMYADGTIIIEGDDIDITGTEHIEIIAPKIYLDDVEVTRHNQQFRLRDHETGEILAHHKYKLSASTGETLEGISDENGLTGRLHTKVSSEVTVEILK
ncbi:hypothetical protein, partial [Sulfuricurvum sp.]|uniref:hypothetical protein n=1 Tax=Sulfuricurvum sp. TaxID=2025608 RepID=UPI00260506A2